MTHDRLYHEMLTEIESIPTVDAHEHLPPEDVRLKEPRDFYRLENSRCESEGMPIPQ